MAHTVVPEADKLLDKEFKVLDHGFIRMVDYMGGDARIVQSARVSYGEGTKTVRQDEGLIRYLLRNEHMSPFEQVVFTFHVKMPIFVARQWVRHRTARMNEISGRYSVMSDDFFVPEPDEVRYQSTTNMQGSDETEVPAEMRQQVIDTLNQDNAKTYEHYTGMIDNNIAREIARVNLPLSLYTQIYWQIDLRNLLHFIRLRADHHAQKEIRVYADVLADIVKTTCPLTWAAFEEYQLYGAHLSRTQINALVEALEDTKPEVLEELGLKKR